MRGIMSTDHSKLTLMFEWHHMATSAFTSKHRFFIWEKRWWARAHQFSWQSVGGLWGWFSHWMGLLLLVVVLLEGCVIVQKENVNAIIWDYCSSSCFCICQSRSVKKNLSRWMYICQLHSEPQSCFVCVCLGLPGYVGFTVEHAKPIASARPNGIPSISWFWLKEAKRVRRIP
jgi:hypothetical protein